MRSLPLTNYSCLIQYLYARVQQLPERLWRLSGFALSAHASSLTTAQINAILSLVASFGADSTTIANVQASLTGTASVSGSGNASGSVSGSGSSSPSTGTPPGNVNFTCRPVLHTLSTGSTDASTGGDVSVVQNILIHQGFLSGAPTGYFGPLTASAIAKFQTQNGVSAVGVVGPATRTIISTWCASTNMPMVGGTGSGSVSGNDSTFSSVDAQLQGLGADITTASGDASQNDDDQ